MTVAHCSVREYRQKLSDSGLGAVIRFVDDGPDPFSVASADRT